MSTYRRLTQVFEASIEVPFDNSSKLVFFSDCHRGDGSWSDNFARNKNLYMHALRHYYANDFTYVEAGDGDELWENRALRDIIQTHEDTFTLLKKFHNKDRLYMIYGNHDIVKGNSRYTIRNLYRSYNYKSGNYKRLFKNVRIYEGIIFKHEDTQNKIFIVHGHQGDPINDQLWPLGRFLVRYLWKPLESYGVNNPSSPAKNSTKKGHVERNIINWIKANNQITIVGHTHRPMFPDAGAPPYFNIGSCVHPGCITCIEIQNGEIMLVKWCINVKESGTLYVARKVLAGPRKLEEFFR